MEKLIKYLKEREDITILEYFFLMILVIVGITVTVLRFLL